MTTASVSARPVEPAESAVLAVTGLAKHFTKGQSDLVALRDFDLRVEAGEFVVLLGQRRKNYHR